MTVTGSGNPRVLVEVNGNPLRWVDVLSVQVTQTLYMAADTFSIVCDNKDFISDVIQRKQEVRIYMGYVKNPNLWYKEELFHMFTGKIDEINPDFGNPCTLTFNGRDFTAPYLDTEYNVSYAERTASQICEILAKKHGMAYNITPTEMIIPDDIYAKNKEWENIQSYAFNEGFIAGVDKNKEFYFGPRSLDDDTVQLALFYDMGLKSNCKISFNESSVGTFNKVTVKHYLKKTLYQGSAQDDALIALDGEVREKVIFNSKVRSNADANKIAKNMLPEFSRRVVTANVKWTYGVPQVVPEKKTSVEGCGRFSGTYYTEEVVHTINKSAGYTMSMKLSSVRSDQAAQYKQDLYDQNKYITGSKTSLGKAVM